MGRFSPKNFQIYELFEKIEEDLINELIMDIVMLDNDFFQSRDVMHNLLVSSFIEASWKLALDYYAHKRGLPSNDLTLPSLMGELFKRNISYSYNGHSVNVFLTHCCFSFSDNNGAYGGPFLEGEKPKGGGNLPLRKSEIIPFINAFDNYVPRIKYLYYRVISYAQSEADIIKLKYCEIEPLLEKFTSKYPDEYYFISSYNRKNGEATIIAGQYNGIRSLFLTEQYDSLIKNLERYCDECHNVLAHPDKASDYNYIQLENVSECM